MKKYPFIIIFDHISKANEMTEFVNAITTSYVSIRGKENIYIISADENTKVKDIFTILESKLVTKQNFLVVRMDEFFGYFIDDKVPAWLKEQFPQLTFV